MTLLRPGNRALCAVLTALVILHFAFQFKDCLHERAAIRLNRATLMSLTAQLAQPPATHMADASAEAASHSASPRLSMGARPGSAPQGARVLHIIKPSLVQAVVDQLADQAAAAATADAKPAAAAAASAPQQAAGRAQGRAPDSSCPAADVTYSEAAQPAGGQCGSEAAPAASASRRPTERSRATADRPQHSPYFGFAVQLFARLGGRLVFPPVPAATMSATQNTSATAATGTAAPSSPGTTVTAGTAGAGGGADAAGSGSDKCHTAEGVDTGAAPAAAPETADQQPPELSPLDIMKEATWVVLPLTEPCNWSNVQESFRRYNLWHAVQLQMLALQPRLSILLAPALTAAGVRLPVLEWWQWHRLPAFTPLAEPNRTTAAPQRAAQPPAEDHVSAKSHDDDADAELLEGDARALCRLETSPAVWVLAAPGPPGLPSPHRARRVVCTVTVRQDVAAASLAGQSYKTGAPDVAEAAAAPYDEGLTRSPPPQQHRTFTLVAWEELDTYTRFARASGVPSYRSSYKSMSYYHRAQPGWLPGGLSMGAVPEMAAPKAAAPAPATGHSRSQSGADDGHVRHQDIMKSLPLPPSLRRRQTSWWSWLKSYVYGHNGGTLYYCGRWACDPTAYRNADPLPPAQQPDRPYSAAAAMGRDLRHTGEPEPMAGDESTRAPRIGPTIIQSGPHGATSNGADHQHGNGTDTAAATASEPLLGRVFDLAATGLRTVYDFIVYGIKWGAAWRAVRRAVSLAAPMLLPHSHVLRWLWPLAIDSDGEVGSGAEGPDAAASGSGGPVAWFDAGGMSVWCFQLWHLTVTCAFCCYAEWLLVGRLTLRWWEDRQDARGVRLDVDTAATMRARMWREAVEGPVGRYHVLAWRFGPVYPWIFDGWILGLLALLSMLPYDFTAGTEVLSVLAYIVRMTVVGFCFVFQAASILSQACILRLSNVEAATRASKQLLQVAATARMLHDSVASLSLRQLAVAATMELPGDRDPQQDRNQNPGQGLDRNWRAPRVGGVFATAETVAIANQLGMRFGEIATEAGLPSTAVMYVLMALRRFRNGGRPLAAQQDPQRQVVWPPPLELPVAEALSALFSLQPHHHHHAHRTPQADRPSTAADDPSTAAVGNAAVSAGDGPLSGPAAAAASAPAPAGEADLLAPRGFICGITHEIMTQPALLLSPQLPGAPSYEREAIQKWLEVRRTDPRSNTPLRTYQLLPNDDLRRAIDDWARGLLLQCGEAAEQAEKEAAATATTSSDDATDEEAAGGLGSGDAVLGSGDAVLGVEKAQPEEAGVSGGPPEARPGGLAGAGITTEVDETAAGVGADNA